MISLYERESFQPAVFTPAGLDRSNTSKEGSSECFDPLADLLVAQNERPAHLEGVNLRTLTPFHRALLTIDGTVTKFIEAYTMEPIVVVRLDQEMRYLEHDHAWLAAPAGSPVVARQVILQGRYSRKLYAYAVSLLAIERLPEHVIAELKSNPGGLGRVLLSHELETRREVLWYGREHMTALPHAVSLLSDGRFLSRAYRIMANNQPLMLINEKFPLGSDQPLVHH